MKDLWKTAFPVGAEWDQLDALYEFNWDFKHLEEAFEEGGILHGKKVFVFGSTEPQFVLSEGVYKFVNVPTVVAVESPFPPSDKVAITSIQSDVEEIIPMKQMKMHWVPYIPFEERDRQVDRINFQIFSLVCKQRRADIRHLTEDRLRKFHYCLLYFNLPIEEDGVQIIKFYKFYPKPSPDITGFQQSAYINRYYGSAHQVL